MGDDERRDDAVQGVTHAASGGASEAELAGLFEAHADRVFRVAYRITGDAADAEDVLQTVFFRILRKGETPDPSGSVVGYLHRAAVNVALDVIRRRKRARRVGLDDAPEPEDPKPGPDRLQDSQELRQGLRLALAQLSPRAAEMFTLRYVEGYSNREIASMFETSQTAVGVTLHRARHRLRDELGGLAGGAV